MNSLRIILNIVLAIVLLSGGVYLLGQDSFFLNDRNPEEGTLFQGAALYSLASGLFLLGVFAGIVAYSWVKGNLPMPDRNTIRPHPSYMGTLIVRFWYLILPVIVLIPMSFLLADKVPSLLSRPLWPIPSPSLFQR